MNTLSVGVVAGPDPGHAFNAIGLGAELVRRGHDVTVATGTPHREAIEREGGRFLELPHLAPTAGDDDMGYRLWRRAGEMAPPLADLLRPRDLDVVVVDVLTRAGAFAADLLDVPWVELSPHHLFDPDPLVPPVGLGRGPARTPWRRRSDDHIRELQRVSLEAGAALEAEVRRQIGLPATGGDPRARLLCTLPALELPRERWPTDAHVVGSLGWEPPWPPLSPPPGDAPLVVVTDSTASTIRRSLAETALAGLVHAGVRLVVTTGRDDLDVWPCRRGGRARTARTAARRGGGRRGTGWGRLRREGAGARRPARGRPAPGRSARGRRPRPPRRRWASPSTPGCAPRRRCAWRSSGSSPTRASVSAPARWPRTPRHGGWAWSGQPSSSRRRPGTRSRRRATPPVGRRDTAPVRDGPGRRDGRGQPVTSGARGASR